MDHTSLLALDAHRKVGAAWRRSPRPVKHDARPVEAKDLRRCPNPACPVLVSFGGCCQECRQAAVRLCAWEG